MYLNWEDEPDLDQLRELHALLAKNPPDAIPRLELLAERGSLASALYLASFYRGDGLSPSVDNNSKAKHWYSKAHEKGSPEASYMLGHIYLESGQHDLALAAFLKGVEKNYPPAIYRLAKMYQRAEGVPRDIFECRRLLELAVIKKHVFAKRDLAALLLTGKFGWTQALRGGVVLLSLWSDVGLMIWKAIKGSDLDETVIG